MEFMMGTYILFRVGKSIRRKRREEGLGGKVRRKGREEIKFNRWFGIVNFLV